MPKLGQAFKTDTSVCHDLVAIWWPKVNTGITIYDANLCILMINRYYAPYV